MLDEYFSVLQFVIMHKSNAFQVNSTDVYAHLQRDQEIIYLTLCTSKVHNNDCGGRTCIILGVREVITGVNVSDKPDRVRARVWGCRPVPHPTGNGADTRQKKRGADNRSGPRTRNLKPAATHCAVCLQEILEPLSALSGRDNRWQRTYTHTYTFPPTLQARLS